MNEIGNCLGYLGSERCKICFPIALEPIVRELANRTATGGEIRLQKLRVELHFHDRRAQRLHLFDRLLGQCIDFRIAAINGVDVRVRSEDAGDSEIASARIQRFRREIAKAKPGDAVELRVWSDGGYKNMRVTLGKASDYQKTRRGMSMFYDGDHHFSLPRVHVAPMPPMPPMPPMIHGDVDFDFDFDFDPQIINDAARQAVRAVRVNANAIRAAAGVDAARAAAEARASAYRHGWF